MSRDESSTDLQPNDTLFKSCGVCGAINKPDAVNCFSCEDNLEIALHNNEPYPDRTANADNTLNNDEEKAIRQARKLDGIPLETQERSILSPLDLGLKICPWCHYKQNKPDAVYCYRCKGPLKITGEISDPNQHDVTQQPGPPPAGTLHRALGDKSEM